MPFGPGPGGPRGFGPGPRGFRPPPPPPPHRRGCLGCGMCMLGVMVLTIAAVVLAVILL